MFWIYSIIIIVGCFPILAIFYRRKQLQKFIATSNQTTATITGIEFRGLYTKVTISYPTTESGKTISQVVNAYKAPYKINDQFPLCYKIEDPLRTDFYMRRTGTALVIICIISLAASILICILIQKGFPA